MKDFATSFLWLFAIVVLSAVLLSKMDSWGERRVMQRDPVYPTVSVMMVGYADENYPGKEENSDLLMTACEDALIPYEMPTVSTRLKSVMSAMALYKAPEGLHNPMREYDLSFGSVAYSGDTVTVNLLGKPELGGKCDRPRLRMQIEESLKMLTDLDVKILLNGSAEEYGCLQDVFGNCE
jgi:hypothetical protein